MTVSTEVHCLACGSNDMSHWATAHDIEYYAVSEAFEYNLCADCGALSITNPPKDRLSEIYPDNYYSFSENGMSWLMRVKQWFDERQFRHLFSKVQGEKLSALDVGGGAGWLLSVARTVEPRLDYTMVVDLDAAAQDRARAAGHDFYLGPVETYRTDTRFDVIFMLNLIEHVEDPRLVLRKMRELLKPGGVIFLKTPSHDSLDAHWFRNDSWGGLHCPRHWVIFTPESFAKAANQAGLVVREMNLTQGAPFWTVSILNMLKKAGLVKISKESPVVDHPLFGPIGAVAAAFDMVRGVFMRTSQMFVTLESAEGGRG